MAKEKAFRPDWISAPGDTIADLLEERNLSREALAAHIGTTVDQATALLQGRLQLSFEIASALEALFQVPASFWISREDLYRRELGSLQTATQGGGVDEWVKHLPVSDMVRFGWIPPEKDADLLSACLRFFGTPNLDSWRITYRDVLRKGAFRASPSFVSQPNAVAAWIRQGELQSAPIDCKPWDPKRFQLILPTIRPLTRQKDPKVFLPELVRRCAECGVAVAVVRAPSGCRASGATLFLSPVRALLLLSFRYLTDDHFWFTFFHEAGHLLLHGPRALFLEGTEVLTTKEEHEANDFASMVLVPSEFREQLLRLPRRSRDVIRFARQVGVSPGIIVGQIQHLGKVGPRYLNSLKRRYAWSGPDQA